MTLDVDAMLDGMAEHAGRWIASGERHRLGHVIKPMLNCSPAARQPGMATDLTKGVQRPDATPDVIREAYRQMRERQGA